MNLKEFKRNLSLKDLGVESNDVFNELYDYLYKIFNTCNKYVHNNTTHQIDNIYHFGNSPYNIFFAISINNVNHGVLYICESVSDKLYNLIAETNDLLDNSFDEIIMHWLSHKTELKKKYQIGRIGLC